MKSINSTLLLSLFEKPNPQPSNKAVSHIYKTLYLRMFPNPKLFCRFLLADNIDEQYECSQEILQRLCYESNFPPVYEALLDVVAVEYANREHIEKDAQYVPRDHFVHLVYLYILGIYIFFYDPIFYDMVTDSYRFLRKSHSFDNYNLGCVKDFLSAWKYFSLFHDIGYSAEILSNNKNKIDINDINKTKEKVFEKSLSKEQTYKKLLFSHSVKALARIIHVKLLDSQVNLSDTKILTQFERVNVDVFAENKKVEKSISFSGLHAFINGRSWNRIKKISSSNCLKTVLSVVELDDLLFFGMGKQRGELCLICYFHDGKAYIVVPEATRITGELKSIIENPSILTFDDYDSKKYRFSYYCAFDELKDSMLSPDSSISGCMDGIIDDICLKFDGEFEHINNEQQFFSYQFEVYKYIYEYFSEFVDSKEVFEILQKLPTTTEHQEVYAAKSRLSNSLLSHIGTKCSKHLKDTCFDSIRDSIELSFDEDKLSGITNPDDFMGLLVDEVSESIKKLVDKKNFQSFKSKIKQDLTENFYGELERKAHLGDALIEILLQLAKLFSIDDLSYDFNYETKEESFVTSAMDDFLVLQTQENFGTGILASDILSNYEIKHGNRYDHGFVSAKYLFSNTSFYWSVIENRLESDASGILSAIFNCPSDKDMKTRYIDNYKHVMHDVTYAILTHNINPSSFTPAYKSFRTKASEPFAFLSILCDELQQWNRPHGIHLGFLQNKPNRDTGDQFDVRVEDDYVVIYDSNDEKTQVSLNKNLTGIGKKLYNAEAYIRNGFSK